MRRGRRSPKGNRATTFDGEHLLLQARWTPSKPGNELPQGALTQGAENRGDQASGSLGCQLSTLLVDEVEDVDNF